MKPTDPSLQKMQTTPGSNMQKMHKPSDPESNVQKMHIPAEWVEAGSRAAAAANNDDPDFLGYQQDKPNWQLWVPCIEAALSAVIPLIRREAALDQIASEGQWYDLTAERDRYREALKEIDDLESVDTGSYGQGYADALTHASRIARQALKGDT